MPRGLGDPAHTGARKSSQGPGTTRCRAPTAPTREPTPPAQGVTLDRLLRRSRARTMAVRSHRWRANLVPRRFRTAHSMGHLRRHEPSQIDRVTVLVTGRSDGSRPGVSHPIRSPATRAAANLDPGRWFSRRLGGRPHRRTEHHHDHGGRTRPVVVREGARRSITLGDEGARDAGTRWTTLNGLSVSRVARCWKPTSVSGLRDTGGLSILAQHRRDRAIGADPTMPRSPDRRP